MSLPAKPLEYRGDLSETTLPEMLYTIDRFQVAGVIEARRNGVVKRVYLKSGYVAHATSTDLRDSLGGFLERTGRLTREQSTEMMQLRRNSAQRLGVLLIEQGLLAPAEVYQAISVAYRDMDASALGFEKGQAAEYVTASSARKALIPQIERTKVVGLIALPGAMTGMLLAGVDAFDAVLVQLVIMYLLLGSVGLAVVMVVTIIAGKAFTADGRLQLWVTDRG